MADGARGSVADPRRAREVFAELSRPLVAETLAFGSFDGLPHPFPIIHLAPIVAELELRDVAVQVALADRVKRAHQAAFDERKKALNRVGRKAPIAPDVFAAEVVDGVVPALELLPGLPVCGEFVGH